MERTCDNCDGCCSGAAPANIYGHEMYPGKPCHFLANKRCTIYEGRPKLCKDFRCEWVKGNLPEEMHPMKTNLMVSIGRHKGTTYMKSFALSKDVKDIDPAIIPVIEDMCRKRNINCLGDLMVTVDQKALYMMIHDVVVIDPGETSSQTLFPGYVPTQSP